MEGLPIEQRQWWYWISCKLIEEPIGISTRSVVLSADRSLSRDVPGRSMR